MQVRFTPRELDIMGVLWGHGPSTVAEVKAALEDDLAYTTVLTMLKIMESKGYVSRRREGRADRYTPEVARETAGQSALGRITRNLFSGSPEELLVHLVEADLDADQLRRMRDLLDRRLREMEDDE
jgi:BlaI family transcriptional regulator, penicillinase repressor